MFAGQAYDLPPAALYGIYQQEQGYKGAEIKNRNGSADLGVMQINTLWIPELSKHWHVSQDKAKDILKNDVCVNIQTAAWILKQHIDRTGALHIAIGDYHSRTPELSYKYRQLVFKRLHKNGLIEKSDNVNYGK